MIKNKIVLITGGANGIGLATSLLFNKLEAKVIVLDNAKNLNSLKKKFEKDDINIDLYNTDVSNPKQIRNKI